MTNTNNTRVLENNIINIAMLVLNKYGSLNIEMLRREVNAQLVLSASDREYLLNRSFDRKWKQIVRNIVSHRTLEKLGYAYFEPSKHPKIVSGKYYIAPKGMRYAQKLLRG